MLSLYSLHWKKMTTEMKWNKSACKISYELKYNLEYARERNIFSIYMIVMFVGIPGVKCR